MITNRVKFFYFFISYQFIMTGWVGSGGDGLSCVIETKYNNNNNRSSYSIFAPYLFISPRIPNPDLSFSLGYTTETDPKELQTHCRIILTNMSTIYSFNSVSSFSAVSLSLNSKPPSFCSNFKPRIYCAVAGKCISISLMHQSNLNFVHTSSMPKLNLNLAHTYLHYAYIYIYCIRNCHRFCILHSVPYDCF